MEITTGLCYECISICVITRFYFTVFFTFNFKQHSNHGDVHKVGVDKLYHHINLYCKILFAIIKLNGNMKDLQCLQHQICGI